MTKHTLQDISNFFVKRFFGGLPSISTVFASMDDDTDGQFCLRPASEYNEEDDELYDTPGYRLEYQDFEGMVIDCSEAGSWSDPANHPQTSIKISDKCKRNECKIVGVLFHELLHYYCWYCGLEYHDYSDDFIRLAKEKGIALNHINHEFVRGKWIDTYDYSKMRPYLTMYYQEKQACA